MAVFTEESAKANIRVRDGKRVFYLAEGDILTPAAKQWLQQDHVEILPAELAKVKRYKTLQGYELSEKPEYMTHLRADVLVPKDHPRIRLRGLVDLLETEFLLTMCDFDVVGEVQIVSQLKEILEYIQLLMRQEVMEETVWPQRLCGLSEEELREHSHFPQKYYGIPHFMPKYEDGMVILRLNRLRAMVRQAELAAISAFQDQNGNPTRNDLVQAYNRLSSLIWVLMIRRKKEKLDGNKA